jgi:hypothetical protein
VIDSKEKKIYELYASSGKGNQMGPIGQSGTQPQNSFLQNKYQFATYYGQKPQNMGQPQMPQNQMVVMGGQYEYNIDTSQGSNAGSKNQPNLKNQNLNQAQGQTILPKRTPNSELTSYQSEKRLKEYKI